MSVKTMPDLLPTATRRPIGALVTTARCACASPAERSRAFGEVVTRFQDMAFAVAFAVLGDRHQAEDAAQDAFLTAWRNLDNLRDPDAFPGWFQQIVRSACHRMTRGKRVATVALELVAETSDEDRRADPSRHAEARERDTVVRDALARLPEHERTAATLYYLGEYEQTEIATYLGVPVTTVKKRVFSARKRLRERLTPYMELTPMEPTKPVRTEAPEPTTLLRETLAEARPSNDPAFARSVAIWAAIEDGTTDVLTALLTEDASLASLTNVMGETPLHRAARYGHVELVSVLLERGADVKSRTEDGGTPLHTLASGSTRIEIAEKLLAGGADLTATDNAGQPPLRVSALRSVPYAEDTGDGIALAEFFLSRGATPDLWVAAALDRPDVIKTLTEADATLVSQTDIADETPLHVAARAGHRRATKALLDAGADVNAKDASGRTPLSYAVQPGRTRFLPPHASVVTLLTERGGIAAGDTTPAAPTVTLPEPHGAAVAGDVERLQALLSEDPDGGRRRDDARNTPLHHATAQGNKQAVQLLLSRGADPNATAGDGGTPLHRAANGGHRETVALLLARGANPARTDFRGETPLLAACGQDDPSLVETLLTAGSPVGVAGSGQTTPLHRAAERGHVTVLEVLLAHGADKEARNFWGATPLQVATRCGQTETARRLLSSGAEVRTRDNWHRTPLHTAVWAGHVELVRLFLDAGVAQTELSYGYSTPLHVAAGAGHADVAEMLIVRGATVNAQSDFLRTPLHDAVQGGHADVVRLLLRHGANPNLANDRGSTPLHWAAAAGKTEIAQLLVNGGADRTLKTGKEETPADLATRHKHTALAQMLAV